MTVVADASPLIALSCMNMLWLLKLRFPDGIIIPQAVWREVVEQGSGRPGAEAVRSTDWIRVEKVVDEAYVRLLGATLDEGEAEAVALAHEQRADVILLDDKPAREAAKQLGLQVIGVVGLLVWAKTAGHVPELEQALGQLQNEAGFRLSPSVVDEALRLAEARR